MTRTLLFLGRISEEKGLLVLLEAWKSLGGGATGVRALPTGGESGADEWRLVIAGPDWGGYLSQVHRKCRELGLAWTESATADASARGIVFTGAADAELKDRLYRAADVFVLPSPMENFSMVVLEALAYGVPAIATKGTPWGELEDIGAEFGGGRCGWWIEQGVVPLAAALREAMALTERERAAMGARGRELARRKYSWRSVADTLLAAYNGKF